MSAKCCPSPLRFLDTVRYVKIVCDFRSFASVTAATDMHPVGPEYPMKKHQFTLRYLLLYVTVLASVLGVATAFPADALSLTLLLLVFSPALIISTFAIWRSARCRITVAWIAAAVLIALLQTPAIMYARPPLRTIWDSFMLDFTSIGLSIACASLMAALVDAGLQRTVGRPT